MNDTVIVFDRIREYNKILPALPNGGDQQSHQ